ncbi:MAG: class I SAM-dependent methyltransferase [Spirochaetales bacterium]|nr:class I SAM-dependent methyltransferase [Spirochaetales bacterium]
MAWVQDDRFYPKEIDPSNEFQHTVLRVFFERYEVAVGWLRERFTTGPIRILDMACGSGYGSSMLSELGEAVGVDIGENAVSYAQETYGQDGITFRVGSADDPAFLDTLGKFDAIVSIATIEHVDDVVGFLTWMRQALKPDGVCILCFPSSLTCDWANPHHKRDISVRQAARLFTQIGFRVVNDFHQSERITLKDLLSGDKDHELPAPPLWRWILYYLLHPHHLFVRLYELVFRRGFTFSHQQYLLVTR